MTGQRPAPTTSKNQRQGPSFHGSPVEASTRSDERSCAAHRAVAVRHQRADQRRGHTEHVDAVPLHEGPEPFGIGVVGRAVVQHERPAVGERADDLPRSHDPTDVGEPEQALAGAEVHLERDLFGDLHEEARVHVHRTLGPAGGAARIRDEQRMLAVDSFGLDAISSASPVRSSEPHIAVGMHRDLATQPRDNHDRMHARNPRRPASSAISFICTTLPRRVNPSAVTLRPRPRPSSRTATASAP